MTFFLTPRFAPTAAHCGPSFCAPRPAYRQSAPAPVPALVPSFVPFLNQVEELLAKVEGEAQRVAHAQRQQRKRIFRARFDVRENGNGYEVEGELPGFEQENISIEVTDEHTLKVVGKQTPKTAKPALTENKSIEALSEKLEGATLNKTEKEYDDHSDISSHKSYQPTVEDDYEDLGADASFSVSRGSAPSESKGKEQAVEAPASQQQASAPQRSQPPQQPQDQKLLSERQYGSFERNFQFSDRIDSAGVRASLRNGVLSISVPKAPVPVIKNITIQ